MQLQLGYYLTNIALKLLNIYFLLVSTVRLWTGLDFKETKMIRMCHMTRGISHPQLLFAFLHTCFLQGYEYTVI